MKEVNLIIMNRVVLITTEGCEGCDIMKRIVSNAYLEAKVENISFGCYDFKEREVEDLVKKYNIKDFPTTLFIKENELIDKILGTSTKEEIISRIRNNFLE